VSEALALARKFTRANCFNVLSALLRKFFAPSLLSEALVLRRRKAASKNPPDPKPIEDGEVAVRGHPGRTARPRHFVSNLDEAKNSEKRKTSFRQRKRRGSYFRP
jgi:hypothetical protein